MRIATRVTLLLLLAVALVMAGFAILRNHQERQRLVGEVQQEALVLASAIKLVVEHARRDRRPQDIQQMLAEMVQEQYPIDRVRIYDRRLEETASASSEAAAPPGVPREEIASVLESGRNLVRYLDSPTRPVVYVILPLRGRRGEAVGVLEVVQAASRVRREISEAARENILRISLLSLTIVLVIWMAARVSIRRPLDRLVQATLAFGRGELDQRISHRRRDEIGQLATAFNRMAEELQRTQGELVEQGQTRLELERQLQQGQKLAAVGRLASEVAHEVGTPLNIISGRAESIRKGLPADHPAERHVATILRQTERITGSLRELLDYTRPRRPAVRPHPVCPLLSRLVELLEPLAQRRGVELRMQVAAGLLPIQADADLFQQALMNLVTNALDATPPGGRVQIVAAVDSEPGPGAAEARPSVRRGVRPDPCVTILVEDAGGGIPAQRLERILEPFFSTKAPGRGTGLGLSIVEDIVRAHGGAIEIASAEGRGTTVLLHWPAAPESGEE
ncbi:MAG: ATP-binding protein [candidate division NC10 bacterium]|nr:ATP-binding protein [candidate division NC10 bacterium]